MVNEQEFQNHLSNLIDLVTNRSQGKLDEERVEAAVSHLLDKAAAETNPSSNDASQVHVPNANGDDQIIPDEDDYDDNLDVQESRKPQTETQTQLKPKPQKQSTSSELGFTGPLDNLESLQSKPPTRVKRYTQFKHWEVLNDIPLGRMGAKMMVTFGDGSHPDPDACEAALMGTRQCLQNAIQDARAYRRKMKADFTRAKRLATLPTARKNDRQSILEDDTLVDPEMMYKALGGGSDPVMVETKCGFDEVQLEKLFPEEMRAFQRWKVMHKAYTESKDSDATKSQTHDDKEQDSSQDVMGGHLHQRMAQFDARTHSMKQDWYLAFSEVRTGSFISKMGSSKEDRQWDKDRKGTKRGRRRGRRQEDIVTWESLPAPHVQFLHWVGFDPRSALPPPKEATTEALAFLGYDFMGKIVEKAIFLRCLEGETMRRGLKNKGETMILQMKGGEQLTKEDINAALQDSTVVPKPLYTTSDHMLHDANATQLYFGPGFEERIEMEMDQIVMGEKEIKLTAEEKAIRAKEDELFDKLKAPPTKLEGIMDILGDEEKSGSLAAQRATEKIKRRKLDKEKSSALKRASFGK